MREDYVWDKSGDAEPDLVALERTLGTLRHNQPMGALASGTFQRAPVAKPSWAKPIVYGALLSSSLTVLLIWLFLQLGGSGPDPLPPRPAEPASITPAPVTAPAPPPKQAEPKHDPKEVERLRRDLQSTLDRLDALVLRLEELEKKQAERDLEAKARAKAKHEAPPPDTDPLSERLDPPKVRPEKREPEKARPKKRSPGVECILDPAKCGTIDPDLPEKLNSSDIKAGIAPTKSAAKSCGPKYGAAPGEKVTVKLTIEGSTGRITSASATGRHAGTVLGACVAAALSKATFPRFRKSSLGVQYPIRF